MKGVCFVTSAATFQGWLLVGAGRFSSAQNSVLILGIEITAWLSELPLLPKVARFPKWLFLCG